MSEENVEIVRRIYAGWERGDFRVGWEEGVYDPEVLLILGPDFGPDAGAFRGLDEIRRYTQGLLAAWEGFVITGEEFIDAGDSVVVRTHQQGTGTGSGVPTELAYFHVWSFRGGSVIRVEAVRERAKALETAGLSE